MTRKVLTASLLSFYFLFAGFAFAAFAAFANEEWAPDYSFLDEWEQNPPEWTPELTGDEIGPALDPLETDLSPFYSEFARDGRVTMYVGYGYEAYFPGRPAALYNMLVSLSAYHNLPLTKWSFDGTTVRFHDQRRDLDYVITIGNERDEFMESFADHEVVMYHGHSRYGQGPAFRGFSNYFRIGTNFSTIEIDTRNGYFKREPLMRTDKYPPREVIVDGRKLPYQYRGQMNRKSYLPPDSFTKLIPGDDVDLVSTRFLPGRQLIYLYSCKNQKYFQKSLRRKLPDPSQKVIFGTKADGYGGTKPTAVMIMSIVRRLGLSTDIVRQLNATNDCGGCFTSY